MPFDTTDSQWAPHGPIADLAGAATLADTIAKVNVILTALREASIITEA